MPFARRRERYFHYGGRDAQRGHGDGTLHHARVTGRREPVIGVSTAFAHMTRRAALAASRRFAHRALHRERRAAQLRVGKEKLVTRRARRLRRKRIETKRGMGRARVALRVFGGRRERHAAAGHVTGNAPHAHRFARCAALGGVAIVTERAGLQRKRALKVAVRKRCMMQRLPPLVGNVAMTALARRVVDRARRRTHDGPSLRQRGGASTRRRTRREEQRDASANDTRESAHAPSQSPSASSYSPSARLSKRVYSRSKRTLAVPVGPLRCLATMSSAMLGSCESSRL